LLLAFAFISLFRQTSGQKWLIRLLATVIFANAAYHSFGIIMRWYIGGYAPWSNAYETMIYVSFITVMAGMFFIRRSVLTFALAGLFAGVILFVAGLNWMDPQISPLVPVLKSPWLMIHVAVIVAAYGFFGISFLLGITNLLLLPASRKKTHPVLNLRIRELSIVNEMSLWLGLALMTTGTFLGAVWANESWGRYWGWDPKETWALVTIVVYAIVTHLRLVKKWDSPLLFNLMSVIAFACVLMTYFGVNYFLSGMHAYG
jgi:cytochrome c-type biogenesis protein CcsB